MDEIAAKDVAIKLFGLFTQNIQMSPFFKLQTKGIDILRILKARLPSDSNKYYHVYETNVDVQEYVLHPEKKVKVGLRVVANKVTLCYIDSFVMCDIDISKKKMNQGVASIEMCKQIYDAVVGYASQYPHLVKSKSAVAVKTRKGLHVYFETSASYVVSEHWYDMAKFLMLINDANYVIRWCLDRTRGFCDKIYQVKRPDYLELALLDPLFKESESDSTQQLLKLRRDFAKLLTMDNYKSFNTAINAFNTQYPDTEKFTPWNMNNIINVLPDIDLHFPQLTQEYDPRLFVKFLLAYQKPQEFVTDEAKDPETEIARQMLSSIFMRAIRKENEPPLQEEDIPRIERRIDALVNVGMESASEMDEHIYAYRERLKKIKAQWTKNATTKTVKRMFGKELPEFTMELLAKREDDFTFEFLWEIYKYLQIPIITPADVAFLNDTSHIFHSMWTVQFFRDIANVTVDTPSLMPLYIFFKLNEYMILYFLHFHIIQASTKIELSDKPSLFEELQEPEAKYVLEKIGLDRFFKVISLSVDEDMEFLAEEVPLQLSLDSFTLEKRETHADIFIRYSWEDIEGFTRGKHPNPNQKELDFYNVLHNIFSMSFNIEEMLHEYCIWTFVPSYGKGAEIQEKLGMADIIDVKGITNMFVTNMCPRLTYLADRAVPIAHMLIGDFILQKLQSSDTVKYTMPYLFEDAGSYMYILCGDMERCKCDLMVNYSKNYSSAFTCENIDTMLADAATSVS